MACSSLGVFRPVKCFNLFDGAFIYSVIFFMEVAFVVMMQKKNSLKARAGYAPGICGWRRLMCCGGLEGTITQD